MANENTLQTTLVDFSKAFGKLLNIGAVSRVQDTLFRVMTVSGEPNQAGKVVISCMLVDKVPWQPWSSTKSFGSFLQLHSVEMWWGFHAE